MGSILSHWGFTPGRPSGLWPVRLGSWSPFLPLGRAHVARARRLGCNPAAAAWRLKRVVLSR